MSTRTATTRTSAGARTMGEGMTRAQHRAGITPVTPPTVFVGEISHAAQGRVTEEDWRTHQPPDAFYDGGLSCGWSVEEDERNDVRSRRAVLPIIVILAVIVAALAMRNIQQQQKGPRWEQDQRGIAARGSLVGSKAQSAGSSLSRWMGGGL